MKVSCPKPYPTVDLKPDFEIGSMFSKFTTIVLLIMKKIIANN